MLLMTPYTLPANRAHLKSIRSTHRVNARRQARPRRSIIVMQLLPDEQVSMPMGEPRALGGACSLKTARFTSGRRRCVFFGKQAMVPSRIFLDYTRDGTVITLRSCSPAAGHVAPSSRPSTSIQVRDSTTRLRSANFPTTRTIDRDAERRFNQDRTWVPYPLFL
ncbi:uncharacterized protein SCHCODRAFT_02245539 [Schizophyllum commune H4-8]|uniref:uncharacterized protein n=1 Tax=Schizophyllum commune (strain H4-8 / FGSC 9210) TaxID=578458 RepID=UPI00215E447D|nr:uncharacterized protein SCHCODRAFT_02245539 [Schizophyllum commune H4-8]KAI5893118.1 hypothetical protein SCHCODRAFT_02245539 [Schizophyllum commune H4-8]